MDFTFTDEQKENNQNQNFGTHFTELDIQRAEIDKIVNEESRRTYHKAKESLSSPNDTYFTSTSPTKEIPTSPSFRGGSLDENFDVRQKWVGIVTNIQKDVFSARLVDATSNQPDITVEFYKEELDSEDLDLLIENALFYFSVGYLNRVSGRIKVSIIRFKREPKWTKNEISRAKQKAEDLINELGWNEV